MLYISHRGNLYGPNPINENNPDYINACKNMGFAVEIDVWLLNDGYYLGHDFPLYKTTLEFIDNPLHWVHAKNADAFHALLQRIRCNLFWHSSDDYVLTNKGIVWCHSNRKVYPNSICVLPELGYGGNISDCFGICSDYIYDYSKGKTHNS